ncbi:MAG TPA: FHA domain-containing protein [Gammaproteobacteria bacterium]|nr:FHA domain-containing protein [Gammaproteobacteria bacterium]
MGILDSLKKQADAVKDRSGDSSDSEIRGDARHRAVVASLRSIHSFLHDMVEQLYVVDSDVSVDYAIPEVGTVNGLHQGRYELQATTRGETEVQLSYHLFKDGDSRFEVPGEVAEMLQHGLRENGLWVVSEKNAEHQGALAPLLVKSQIPVRFVFQEDFADGIVRLRIENYETPGSQQFVLQPEQVTDAFLDEMGKYILRMKNNFMNKLKSRVTGMKPDEEEDLFDTQGLPKTKEMSNSRIMSLFNREAHLYLAYNDVIKELSSRSPEFIFGRASDCDMVVPSEFASRQHARILFRKGKFVLIDQSRNGTFVKTQGGKEVYIQGEEVPLSGSGFISLGKSASVSNAHMIYYNIQ